MKVLILTAASLLLIFSASVYAKAPEDKLDTRVEVLEEENAIQQGQIDENTDGRVILEGLTLQQQGQIDQNNADIGLLWEADAQQQEQIDANAVTPQPIEPQKITSAPIYGTLLTCQLINVSDRAYEAKITIQPFTSDAQIATEMIYIGGYAHKTAYTPVNPDYVFCTIEWTGKIGDFRAAFCVFESLHNSTDCVGLE